MTSLYYNSAQVQCKWCGRSFSHPSAKHHIPFCEKWTKEHGTPLNPAGKTTARDLGSKNQKAKEVSVVFIVTNKITSRVLRGKNWLKIIKSIDRLFIFTNVIQELMWLLRHCSGYYFLAIDVFHISLIFKAYLWQS